jgi:hypothetical protein
VFIGRNLDEAALRKAFNGCLLWTFWSCVNPERLNLQKNAPQEKQAGLQIPLFGRCLSPRVHLRNWPLLLMTNILDSAILFRGVFVLMCVWVQNQTRDMWIENFLATFLIWIRSGCDKLIQSTTKLKFHALKTRVFF